jgi:hypothetical protein
MIGDELKFGSLVKSFAYAFIKLWDGRSLANILRLQVICLAEVA